MLCHCLRMQKPHGRGEWRSLKVPRSCQMFTGSRVDSHFVLATCFRWGHVHIASFREPAGDSTGCRRSSSALVSPKYWGKTRCSGHCSSTAFYIWVLSLVSRRTPLAVFDISNCVFLILLIFSPVSKVVGLAKKTSNCLEHLVILVHGGLYRPISRKTSCLVLSRTIQGPSYIWTRGLSTVGEGCLLFPGVVSRAVNEDKRSQWCSLLLCFSPRKVGSRY